MANAQIIDPHEYTPHEEANTCSHDGAADHHPCRTCGSAQDAFVHTDEAARAGYELVLRDAGEHATSAEKAGQ